MNKGDLVTYLEEEVAKHQKLYLQAEIAERVGFRQNIQGLPVEKLKKVQEQKMLSKDYIESTSILIKEIKDKRYEVPCSQP